MGLSVEQNLTGLKNICRTLLGFCYPNMAESNLACTAESLTIQMQHSESVSCIVINKEYTCIFIKIIKHLEIGSTNDQNISMSKGQLPSSRDSTIPNLTYIPTSMKMQCVAPFTAQDPPVALLLHVLTLAFQWSLERWATKRTNKIKLDKVNNPEKKQRKCPKMLIDMQYSPTQRWALLLTCPSLSCLVVSSRTSTYQTMCTMTVAINNYWMLSNTNSCWIGFKECSRENSRLKGSYFQPKPDGAMKRAFIK